MKKGPFEVTDSREVYKNPWITVREDSVVRPNGEEGIFGVVDNGEGVSVVAVDDKKIIYLVREYYYALDEYALQLPSGAIETGQSSLDAAKAELHEEAGVTADTWTELGMINPLTMIIRSSSYLYLAQDLVIGESSEDDIEVIAMPFEKAYEMVLDSEITHGPSCVAILKAKRLLT